MGQTGPKRSVELTCHRSAGVVEGTPAPKSQIWRLKGIDILKQAVKAPGYFVLLQHC